MLSRGLLESREKAQRLIRAGQVLVGDQVVDLPSTKVLIDAEIRLKGVEPFVGRGGVKLSAALDYFKIDVKDKVALDVGASTGGFTDCLLQRGAVKIYAVDVGYNQLDWRLRQDTRVVVREKTNARFLSKDLFTEPISLAVMDVSFISITLILPVLSTILVPQGEVISLVKPQFEAGRAKIGKGGIIKDVAVHQEVLEKIATFCTESGWEVKGFCDSPIFGAKGNKEFFVYLKNKAS